ncbi:MAG: SH3 domain-containing protein [Coriobacteriia bacterium]
MTAAKVARALLGLVVLGALIWVVYSWWGDYRNASASGSGGSGSTTTTESVPATNTSTPTEQETSEQTSSLGTILILADGLNFREQPTTTAASLRKLSKGENLTLLEDKGSWLQVQDSTGMKGWIANSPQYVKIEKQ